MLLEEVIKKRRSVRSYLESEVPDDLVERILKLANLAPSAGNLQARKVLVVKDPSIIIKIMTCGGFGRFSGTPPVIFVVCSIPEESATRYGDRGRKLYALQDATIFASYLQLAVVSLGLSSCWVGAFDESEVSAICQIPKNLIPVAIIPVGFSSEEPGEKSRKTLKEIMV